jgi:Protein of unknown function (DUF4239)
MNAEAVGLITFALLLAAILAGTRVSENRLSAATKETVKLAASLVATLAALVLGLLVSSAKASYDSVRSEVIEMSAKVVFLDRMLTGYGPESAEARARLREAAEENVSRMSPIESKRPINLAPPKEAGNAVYMAIQNLIPKDDTQRSFKTEASNLALDLGKVRTLLVAQSIPSISKLMLAVLVSWLVIIFFSFSMLAPTNAPAITALVISALSVCGAIALILELDRPFGGLIGLSSEPMRNALSQLAR